MYKIQAFGKVMLVTCAVVVNAAVFAIVGVPWASGDPPVDAGGGPPGGAGPPGGVADAPEGASNADGLWSATVGGIEHAGLGTSDVGRLLWRGNKVSRSILGDDGIPRTVQVCQGFPEIVLETSETGTAPGGGEATVMFDLTNCTVALSELTRTNTGVPDGSGSQRVGPQSLAWHGGQVAGFVPIAWRGDMDVNADSVPATSINDPSWPTWRDSTLRMVLKAADGAGFDLTETVVRRKYLLDSRVTEIFQKNCLARSPARLAGVRWYLDGCTGGHATSLGRSQAWAQGRFHGETTGNFRFNRSTRHTMNLLLDGSQNREIRRCTINPTSIEDLTASGWVLLRRITIGVWVTCRYSSSTGP